MMHKQEHNSGSYTEWPGGATFHELYIALRNAEQRVYSDEEVAQLPEVRKNNIHKKEWKVRKESAVRLRSYLAQKKRALRILEIGCGNGWLSHFLAQVKQATVVGMDVNLTELEQAARVFKKDNLSFFYGDLSEQPFAYKQFDIIVFAASIQYFQSLQAVINQALGLLHNDGEVHILDTQFYRKEAVDEARQRSASYFRKAGFASMIELYFHHSFEGLEKFKYDILYRPGTFINRMLRKQNPFYWIRITATT